MIWDRPSGALVDGLGVDAEHFRDAGAAQINVEDPDLKFKRINSQHYQFDCTNTEAPPDERCRNLH